MGRLEPKLMLGYELRSGILPAAASMFRLNTVFNGISITINKSKRSWMSITKIIITVYFFFAKNPIAVPVHCILCALRFLTLCHMHTMTYTPRYFLLEYSRGSEGEAFDTCSFGAGKTRARNICKSLISPASRIYGAIHIFSVCAAAAARVFAV